MFAIAFDFVVAYARHHHPKRALQAYSDISTILERHGFLWAQGSVYISDSEDLANLLLAMNALKSLPWFPKVVRDIREFRVEQWSDFTGFMKS